MDERKKTIRDLTEKRREDLLAVDLLLEDLGAALLGRFAPAAGAGAGNGAPAGENPAGEASCGEAAIPAETAEAREAGHSRVAVYLPAQSDIAEYHRLLQEIGDYEAVIQSIEADAARLKELEEATLRTEQAGSEQSKAISALYTRLGEHILDDPYLADFTEPYRKQLDDLVSKVKSLEDRLDLLAEKGDANVFSWIGKSAQSVVIRSFLGKNQKNIQRIFTTAGEQFSRSASREGDAGVKGILDEIEGARKTSAELNGELARLREERRHIGESFGTEGNPQRKIRTLERQIAHSREQLKGVYLRYGTRLEKAGPSKGLGALLTADDRARLDKIRQIRKTVKQYDERIETLEASLAIDEEQEGIRKKEKAIAEQRQRISAAEEAIGDFKRQIEEANLRIEELSKKL
ncbi:MAG: hypothetical protein LBQ38_01835 [Spirochaetaceae bacterium]|jgi:chromosome segregation ATPase|nr:hypothetical protein [Spirochaetaceae bacterium]